MNIRGSRAEATEYFIDGIRVRGSTNLPNAAIEQTTVITGGIPAQYGDATGGIINITTRGPSGQFFGGAEVLSSAFVLEPYGYNLFALNFSGPLMKKDGKSILGYFISGEFETQKDPNPSAIGVWQLKDDVYEFVSQNPFRPSIFGSGVNRNSEFVREGDLELRRVRPNANRDRFSIAGKVDFQPTNNFSITIGGNYDYLDGRSYARALSLFSRTIWASLTTTPCVPTVGFVRILTPMKTKVVPLKMLIIPCSSTIPKPHLRKMAVEIWVEMRSIMVT